MSDLNETISIIRSCLLASKGGTPIEYLNRDYKALEDEDIPYRRLGFSNLKELLNKIPGLIFHRRGDSTLVEVIATAETAHIASMVAKQKSRPKKKRRPLERYNIKSRRPNISTNTNYSRISQLSSSSRNTNALPTQRANTKSSNTLSRNSYHQPSLRQSSAVSSSTTTTSNLHKVVEQQKPIAVSNSNRPNRNATPAPLNYPSSSVNREVNGKNSLHVSPPHPPSSQHTRISERLVRPPPLPIPNLSRNVSENTNIDRRVTFALPEVRNLPAKVLPSSVAPLSTIPSPKTIPPSSLPSPELKDPRDELLYLVRSLKLAEPEYKIVQSSKQNKINAKLCFVMVGAKKYSNYPAEAKTDEEAQKLAAAQAVLDIHKSHGPLVQLQVTSDVDTIKQRIIAIVDVHNGVLIEQLPIYYKQNHNETLPENWISIIEDCPKDLTLEKNGVNNSFILWRYNEAIHKTRQLSPLPHLDNAPSVIGDAMPTPLILPTENLWPVYVQNVANTCEIWVVILEDNYNPRLVAMTAEMSKSNVANKHPARSIEVGRYYIIKEDEGCFRVRVDNKDNDTNEADIFFIDTGDYDTVSYDQLYPLDKRFCDVPPQAIKLSLFGLEDFSDCDMASNSAENLLVGQQRYVCVNSREDTDNDLILNVTLYDTSGDDDINVNDLILQELFTSNESLQLQIDGRVIEVFISNIEANGDIYVQMKTEGLKIVAALINRLIDSPKFDFESFKKAAVMDNIDTGEIYLAKCPDGNWMRSKVMEILTGRKLKMLFIDFGGSVIVDSAKLLRLRALSATLEKYPPQAHKVQLHNIEKSNFNEQMMNRLMELAPHNERLLCKVIKSTDVPIVELFKRSQPDNVLISINNTLALIPEIDRNIEDGNNNVKPKKRLERTLSRCNSNDNDGTLKCLRRPPIPPVGGLFEVHVTNLAANPSNFIVQPYNDMQALMEVMNQLQESCNNYKGPMLTGDSLRVGKLCAAKYNDGWYRACINGIIDSQTVVVYLCDYGDMTPIGTEQLQPLKKQFTELPYQGIKARLHGIAPINVDWTPLTCTMFQNLVANKNFASVIHHVEKDITSPTESIVSLELIDVNTEVDIRIHETLVKEKRAILTG